ncbi:Hypothetical protein RY67_2254 [Bifidobacterium longum subsp. infantis]|uniref:Uncharacterized protein n=1 Tax=Bifidobacterium longum subsp. infantis TaxID=1682 RepID=A0A0M4MIT0_BIFLI|nr:Hypothetical protein RY67_2254 [Bifidobacterium longum subsp. infantis]
MLDTLRVEHVNSKRFWILLIACERHLYPMMLYNDWVWICICYFSLIQ